MKRCLGNAKGLWLQRSTDAQRSVLRCASVASFVGREEIFNTRSISHQIGLFLSSIESDNKRLFLVSSKFHNGVLHLMSTFLTAAVYGTVLQIHIQTETKRRSYGPEIDRDMFRENLLYSVRLFLRLGRMDLSHLTEV
jgi:hypothetical protein